MGILHYIVALGIIVVCVLLVIIILLQKGRGGGLSAAFGGGGSGSAFGAKTGDVFTWITVAFACLYLVLNVAGNYTFRQVVEEPATPVLTGPPTEGTAAPGGAVPAEPGAGQDSTGGSVDVTPLEEPPESLGTPVGESEEDAEGDQESSGDPEPEQTP